MSELADFALIILVVAAALVAAIGATKLTERVPVPAPVLVLVAAAVASDLWPDLGDALSTQAVERVAVVALIVILLNGGMDIGWRHLRSAAGPVLSIGVLGTFITAAALAAAAKLLLGVDWVLAGIVGAALAPTDPAVVFSVLGRREIAGRSGKTRHHWWSSRTSPSRWRSAWRSDWSPPVHSFRSCGDSGSAAKGCIRCSC